MGRHPAWCQRSRTCRRLSLKRGATGPGTHPGSLPGRVTEKAETLGGGGDLARAGLHKFRRADSPGGLIVSVSMGCCGSLPSAPSFELMNLEYALLPPSRAFAQTVHLPECVSSLLCPAGYGSVPPPAGSPSGCPGGPRLGEGTPWLQSIWVWSLSPWGRLPGSRAWWPHVLARTSALTRQPCDLGASQ